MIETQPSVTSRFIDGEEFNVEVSVSVFRGESGVEEYHLMLRPLEYSDTATQLEWIADAYGNALRSFGLDYGTCVFKRFFCSDPANQEAVIADIPLTNRDYTDETCAISLVGQPPIPPAKIAMWAYHVNDPSGRIDKTSRNGSVHIKRGELTHIWTPGIARMGSSDSYGQTEDILTDYERYLRSLDLTLSDNVIRTWFYLRDVDANYQGLVDARKKVFAECGLTADTHFIASTGIQGSSADVAATVTMDAYAIAGMQDKQVKFLTAPEYMCPTHAYGVTFERGVSVAYRDRKHIFVSGTASIDNAGVILHPGDVLRQLDRTLENVGALLMDADAGFGDVSLFIVYVRDPSDLDLVKREMSNRFGSVPVQVVSAPVCRPGWLVEIECQAITAGSANYLPRF